MPIASSTEVSSSTDIILFLKDIDCRTLRFFVPRLIAIINFQYQTTSYVLTIVICVFTVKFILSVIPRSTVAHFFVKGERRKFQLLVHTSRYS